MRIVLAIVLMILTACSEGGMHYGVKKTLMGGYHGNTSTHRPEQSGVHKTRPSIDSCTTVNSSGGCD